MNEPFIIHSSSTHGTFHAKKSRRQAACSQASAKVWVSKSGGMKDLTIVGIKCWSNLMWFLEICGKACKSMEKLRGPILGKPHVKSPSTMSQCRPLSRDLDKISRPWGPAHLVHRFLGGENRCWMDASSPLFTEVWAFGHGGRPNIIIQILDWDFQK